MTTFTDLGLSAPILKALADEGYDSPTPIQAQAIPHVLAGRDLQGIAQTGTGKTAAFALPILQRITADKRPAGRRACRVLVLSPTRELASQIQESFAAYGRHLGLTSDVVFGGVNINRQIRDLANGVDILVATPGRLLDLARQRAIDISRIDVFVLDEADQMLDMGFIHDIRKIVSHLPAQRQSLFFSATMPREIADLAGSLLRDPVQVAVTPVATTAERVDQSVIFVEAQRKQDLLHALLKSDETINRALIFARTKHGADKVVRRLAGAGIAAAAIHGNKSQSNRERALADFKSGAIRLLVATDIAARGIDVERVSHVINFDLPNVPESYVHRIGRTARAGASGLAISFCAGDERPFLRDIERLTRQKVPVVPAPEGVAVTGPTQVADNRRAEEPAQAPAGRNGQGRGGQGRDGQGRGRPSGAGHGGRSFQERTRQDRSRSDNPRHDGPRQDGPRQDGPRQDAVRAEGVRHNAPRQDGPRQDRPREDRAPRREWSPVDRTPMSADEVRPDDRGQRQRPRQDEGRPAGHRNEGRGERQGAPGGPNPHRAPGKGPRRPGSGPAQAGKPSHAPRPAQGQGGKPKSQPSKPGQGQGGGKAGGEGSPWANWKRAGR